MRVLGMIALTLGLSLANSAVASISTIDFVKVINGKAAEAKFYYQHNWQAFRKKAVDRGYIESWQLLAIEYSEQTPYHYILLTTYANEQQFEQREANFQALIKEQGEIKLLNELKPGEFRETVNRVDATNLR